MKKNRANSREPDRAVSRRSFMKAGIAFGVPLFIPSSVLGRGSATPASERISLGFIGVGCQGQGHLNGNAFTNVPGGFIGKHEVQVRAVCDVDSGHRNQAMDIVNSHYGNMDCAAYNDFRELLARDDIDAVVIAAPDHWHAPIGIAAARAGKDVYCEKPLAHNIAEGKAVVEAVRQHGTVWQTGSQQRSWKAFRDACELVRNGRIGTLKQVRVGLPEGGETDIPVTSSAPPPGFDYEMWLGPAPWAPYCEKRCHVAFRNNSDYAHSAIGDWGGHHIDIAQWGMGTDRQWPVDVEGEGSFNRHGLYNNITRFRFQCRFANGLNLIVEDSGKHPQALNGKTFTRCWADINMGVLFEGTEGWVHVNRGGMDVFPDNIATSPVRSSETRLYHCDDHRQNFLDCIRTRREPISPPEITLCSIGIGYLGLIAMKLQRPVQWDPQKEMFIQDPQADRLLSREPRAPWRNS
ncbi:MAG: Gfo/Idh/MocA family oxidoreductase [Candidatus Sumerlaeaceae bacterium]